MKKLITTLSILIFLGYLIGGYFLGQHISSVLDYSEGLFVFIVLICASIWFGRRNKDGIYRIFKDIHQSNLDDIERQELEDPIDQTIVKKQIKTSLEIVTLFWLILFLLICGTLFVFMPDLSLVNWLKLLSIIPIILTLRFLKDKLILTIKNMGKSNLDDIEEHQLEEQEA